MSATEKVSFTIRRPTPVSRAPSSGADSDTTSYKIPSLPRHITNRSDSTPGSPLARSTASSPGPTQRGSRYSHQPDSSDEEDDFIRDELVTGFDKFGVRRLNKEKTTKATPLIIPALKNRDWREVARKRRSAAQYVPPSAKTETGKDGSVGGLGVRDSINSGPVLSGLQFKGRPATIKQEEEVKQEDADTAMAPAQEDVKMEVEDDEDKRALRAILAETNGVVQDGPVIDIIPVPISEADAYKQDVEELPDAATLDDYARVPVSQFGAALLRGMGWKEGTAATRQPGKGLVQPYLPEARPALLGIGAKEQEVLDDGRQRKGGPNKRPERRYVPLVKKEKEGEPSSSTSESRSRPERSRSPRSRNGASSAVSRRSSRSRERERGSDRDYRRRDREPDYVRDRDRDRRRGDSDKDRQSDYDRRRRRD